MPRTLPPPPDHPRTEPGRRRLRLPGPPGGWAGALREFAVIFAGVLVALGAQAWWEGREEREREREHLAQMLADTRENGRRLDEAIAEDSVVGIALARALTALEGPGPAPAPDSLGAWIYRAGNASDFRPLIGTYRAVLGTGDLRLVRNDSLRALIVAHAAALESEDERLQQYRGVILDLIGPFGRALPFMRRVFMDDVEVTAADVSRLRNDPEVATVLFTLQAANSNRLGGLRRARRETSRMLQALEAEPALRAAR